MKTVFTVEGMSCAHCKKTVEGAAMGVSGVTAAEVDLAAKTATVSGEGFEVDAVKAAVEDQGFDVTGIH